MSEPTARLGHNILHLMSLAVPDTIRWVKLKTLRSSWEWDTSVTHVISDVEGLETAWIIMSTARSTRSSRWRVGQGKRDSDTVWRWSCDLHVHVTKHDADFSTWSINYTKLCTSQCSSSTVMSLCQLQVVLISNPCFKDRLCYTVPDFSFLCSTMAIHISRHRPSNRPSYKFGFKFRTQSGLFTCYSLC